MYMIFLKLIVYFAHLPGSIFGKKRDHLINLNMQILILGKSNKISADNLFGEVLNILAYASSYQLLNRTLEFY